MNLNVLMGHMLYAIDAVTCMWNG